MEGPSIDKKGHATCSWAVRILSENLCLFDWEIRCSVSRLEFMEYTLRNIFILLYNIS